MPLDININENISLSGGFQQDPFDSIQVTTAGLDYSGLSIMPSNEPVGDVPLIPKLDENTFGRTSFTTLKSNLDRYDDEELKYDLFSTPEQNEYRYANAKSWSQFRNGLFSRFVSIAPKVLQGAAHVSGAFGAIATGDINKIWDNAAVEVTSKFDEQLREWFPVYASEEYSNGSLWDKIWTDKFWYDDAFDGFAFAAAAFVPGLAATKLAGLSSVDKALNAVRASSFMQEVGASSLGKFIAESSKKIGMNGMTGAMTVYNTISEAGFEAYETQKSVYDQYIKNGYDPDTAKKYAADAAKRTFTANSLGLLIPNFIQSKWFFGKGSGDLRSSIKKSLVNGTFKNDSFKLFNGLAKEIGKGILSEGFWEENFQTAIQIHERQLSENMKDTGILNYMKDVLLGVLEGVGTVKALVGGELTELDKERATSIILGGLIGTVMGGSSKILENKSEQEVIKGIQKSFDDFKKDNEVFLKSLTSNTNAIYKQVDGQTVLDVDALGKIMFARMVDTSLFTSYFAKVMAGDETGADLVKSQILSRYYFSVANSSFFNGNEELINEVIKNNLSSMKPEDISEVDYLKLFQDVEGELKSYSLAFKEAEDFLTPEILANSPEQALQLRDLLYANFVKRAQLGRLFEKNAQSPTTQAAIKTLIDQTDNTIKEIKENATKDNFLTNSNTVRKKLSELLEKRKSTEVSEEERFAANLEFSKLLYENKHLKLIKNNESSFGIYDSRVYDMIEESEIVGNGPNQGLMTAFNSKARHEYSKGMSFTLNDNLNKILENQELTEDEKISASIATINNSPFYQDFQTVPTEVNWAVNNLSEITNRQAEAKAVEVTELLAKYEMEGEFGNEALQYSELMRPNKDLSKLNIYDTATGTELTLDQKEELRNSIRQLEIERNNHFEKAKSINSILDTSEDVDRVLAQLQLVFETVQIIPMTNRQVRLINNYQAENLDVEKVYERFFFETGYLGEAISKIIAYKKSVDNDTTYDVTVSELNKIISNLESLKKYLNASQIDLSSYEMRSLLPRIDMLLFELEPALEAAKINSENRSAQHDKFQFFDELEYTHAGSFFGLDGNIYTRTDVYKYVSKLTDKQKETFKEAIALQKASLLQAFKDANLVFQFTNRRSFDDTEEMLLLSPDSFFYNLVNIQSNVPDSRLAKLLETSSLTMLELDESREDFKIYNFVTNRDEIIPYQLVKDLLEYVTKAKALNLAELILNNPNALKDYLEDVNNNDAVYGLNGSQNIMAFELHRYLNTDIIINGAQVPAFLQAPAGTGKSTSMQVSLKKFIARNKSKMAVVTESKILQSLLATQLGVQELLTTFNIDIHRSLSADIKYLIIDEALGLNPIHLSGFLNRMKQNRPDVKIILIGDSTQIRNSEYAFRNVFGSTGKIFHTIKGSSVPYRTDVNVITETAKAFKNGFELPSDTIQTIASDEITQPGVKGVISVPVSTDLINSNFRKRLESVTGKSIRIVVDTQQKVTAYEELLVALNKTNENIKVVLFNSPDVKGFTFQEMMIDLSFDVIKASTPNFESYDYNDLMYTMLSRAKDFLIVTNTIGKFEQLPQSQTITLGIQETEEKNKQEKIELKEQWPIKVRTELSKLLDVALPAVQPTPVEQPDPDVTEELNPETEENEENEISEEEDPIDTSTVTEEEKPVETKPIQETLFTDVQTLIDSAYPQNRDYSIQMIEQLTGTRITPQGIINPVKTLYEILNSQYPIENGKGEINLKLNDNNRYNIVFSFQDKSNTIVDVKLGELPSNIIKQSEIDLVQSINIVDISNPQYDYSGFYVGLDSNGVPSSTPMLTDLTLKINEMYPNAQIVGKQVVVPTKGSLNLINKEIGGKTKNKKFFTEQNLGKPYLVFKMKNNANGGEFFIKLRLNPKPYLSEEKLNYIDSIIGALNILNSNENKYALNNKDFSEVIKFLPYLTLFGSTGEVNISQERLNLIPSKYREDVRRLVETLGEEEVKKLLFAFYKIENPEKKENLNSSVPDSYRATRFTSLTQFISILNPGIYDSYVSKLTSLISEKLKEHLTPDQQQDFLYDILHGEDLRTGFFLKKYFGKLERTKIDANNPIRKAIREVLVSATQIVQGENTEYTFLRYGVPKDKSVTEEDIENNYDEYFYLSGVARKADTKKYAFRNRIIQKREGKYEFVSTPTFRANEGQINSLILDLYKANPTGKTSKPTDNITYIRERVQKTVKGKLENVKQKYPKQLLWKDRTEQIRLQRIVLLKNTFNTLVKVLNDARLNTTSGSDLGDRFKILQKHFSSSSKYGSKIQNQEYQNQIFSKRVKLDDEDLQKLTEEGIQILYERIQKNNLSNKVVTSQGQQITVNDLIDSFNSKFNNLDNAIVNDEIIITLEQLESLRNIKNHNLDLINKVRTGEINQNEATSQMVRTQVDVDFSYRGKSFASPFVLVNHLLNNTNQGIPEFNKKLGVRYLLHEKAAKRLESDFGINQMNEQEKQNLLSDVFNQAFDTNFVQGHSERLVIMLNKKEKEPVKDTEAKCNGDVSSSSAQTNNEAFGENISTADEMNDDFD